MFNRLHRIMMMFNTGCYIRQKISHEGCRVRVSWFFMSPFRSPFWQSACQEIQETKTRVIGIVSLLMSGKRSCKLPRNSLLGIPDCDLYEPDWCDWRASYSRKPRWT